MDKIEIYWDNKTKLLEQKAIQAWCDLQSVQDKPDKIEILKWKLPIPGEGIRRFVCRFDGGNTPGSLVVAKRCRRVEAVVENTIYREILPNIPIPSVKYYGMVEDADRDYVWLFLEDAGDKVLSPSLVDHRRLSAQWLALMHSSTVDIPSSVQLPHKGPKQYLKRLQTARDAYQIHLVKLELQPNDRDTLKAILSQCDRLLSHWDQLEKYFEKIPWTLVHGDFVTKNLRVRNGQNGMTLFPFDWGEAGWGVPAIDIMHVDIENYYAVLRELWPRLNEQTIHRSAIAGKLFRFIDALLWEMPSFRYEWLEKPMRNMRIYAMRFTEAIQDMKLASHDIDTNVKVCGL